MPYVNVKVLESLTKEQKADVVARMTDALVQALGKNPAAIYVTIDEYSPDDWGVAGELISERMKQK